MMVAGRGFIYETGDISQRMRRDWKRTCDKPSGWPGAFVSSLQQTVEKLEKSFLARDRPAGYGLALVRGIAAVEPHRRHETLQTCMLVRSGIAFFWMWLGFSRDAR